MKKYAEEFNKEAFDWNRALKNAIRRTTPMPKAQHVGLYELAGEWVTCACGNQCSIIPRSSIGEPEDEILRKLGFEFACRITMSHWSKAKQTLKQIEQRSALLIREIKSQARERSGK